MSGWARFIPQALEVVKQWNDVRMARRSIATLFRQAFIDENGALRQFKGEIEQLRFEVDRHIKTNINGYIYHTVTVIRTDLPGGDSGRMRQFRFFTGTQMECGIWRELAGMYTGHEFISAGAIEWPPHILRFSAD